MSESFGGVSMAMIKCKECGKKISDSADKCPHCGAVTDTGCSAVVWLFAIFAILVLGAFIVGFIKSCS